MCFTMQAGQEASLHRKATVYRPSFSAGYRGISRHVPPSGCRALRWFCRQCRTLGSSAQHDRHRHGQAAGRRHALTSHRGVQRRDPGGRCGSEGHQPGRAGRVAAERAWRLVRGQHRVAMPRSSRHDLQKKQRTQPSRIGPTSQSGAGLGSQTSLTSTHGAWSSSMRPVPRPRWPGYEDVPSGESVAVPRCHTGTGRRQPSPGRSEWTA